MLELQVADVMVCNAETDDDLGWMHEFLGGNI